MRRVMPRHLPRKLREIREKLNLGQAEMAAKLKKAEPTVYPGLVSRYEHGKVQPSLMVVLEYARLGGVTMESIVDDKMKLQ
jgi:DNA-binding XRE family transcriptional regulator